MSIRPEHYLYAPFMLKILIYKDATYIDAIGLLIAAAISVYLITHNIKNDNDTETRISDLEHSVKEHNVTIENAKKLLNQSTISNAFKGKQ